jgi:hypothetical protein
MVRKLKYTDEHGVERESKYYGYDFRFQGRRYRSTAKTTQKSVAEEAERELRKQLVDGVNDIVTQPKGKRLQTVAQRLDEYYTDFKKRHPETCTSVKYYVGHLKRVLGSKLLVIQVSERTILDYQNARMDGDDKHEISKAAPKTINDEVSFLLRVLEERGDRLRLKLKRTNNLALPEFNKIGRRYTGDEKIRCSRLPRRFRDPAPHF